MASARAATGGPTIDHDLIQRRLVPALKTLVRFGYFSFEVTGLEHVPREGRVVYVQNHAGWFPLDAFFLGLALSEALGPGATPFFAVHESALAIPVLGPFLRRVGGVPASWFRRPERLPPAIQACAIFPEGVEGNCKPFWEAYRMRDWKRGFVRVAAALEAPIVPAAVIGGEETLPVAWTVKVLQPLVHSIFGLPLAPVPLPARWKVVFHAPVIVPPGGERPLEAAASAQVAADVQRIVQRTLDREAGHRPLARLSSAVAALRTPPWPTEDVAAPLPERAARAPRPEPEPAPAPTVEVEAGSGAHAGPAAPALA